MLKGQGAEGVAQFFPSGGTSTDCEQIVYRVSALRKGVAFYLLQAVIISLATTWSRFFLQPQCNLLNYGLSILYVWVVDFPTDGLNRMSHNNSLHDLCCVIYTIFALL